MSRHLGLRMIYLLREIKARSGIEDIADLTETQVRSLPPELSALLQERFDPALVRDRALPLREFGALWSELIVQGVEFLGCVPAAERTTLADEDLVDTPRKELTGSPPSSASPPSRDGWTARAHWSTTDGAAPQGSCRRPNSPD
ncbi:hypothetical protein [Streptomyces sp. NPDC002088]|uniref:hypothetical protein n=1 Tax=Streptomyces sp. NPDC002088 TaxID=3154665 RepID=UPI0033251541